MTDLLRHDADHHKALPVDPQRTTDDTWITCKAPLPEPMAEHDDPMPARLLFLGGKSSAERQLHAQRGKEASRGGSSGDAFGRLPRLGKTVGPPGIRRQRLELGALRDNVIEVGQGMRPAL